MATFPAPTNEPAPISPLVPLNSPMVGFASPFGHADGQNRDLILEAIRTWAAQNLLTWTAAWQTFFTGWIQNVDDYITANSITGFSWRTTPTPILNPGPTTVTIAPTLYPLRVGDLVSDTSTISNYGVIITIIDATHAVVAYLGSLQGIPGPNNIPTDTFMATTIKTPTSQTAISLYGNSGIPLYYEAELYKIGSRTDLQAIQTACAAATAAGSGNMVRLSARTWDVGNGLNMSGYSCGLIGLGAGYTNTTPSGSVLYASTQTGAVLDMSGWISPDSFRGRVELGKFNLRGSNIADPTKVKSGLRNSGTATGSAYFHDIGISQTGGPGIDYYEAYLCDFERITVITPVGAKANDVAYMIFKGCNGNRFTGMGFRSMTGAADTGASGALIVTDDGTYQSQSNEWVSPWFEFLHIPTGGTFINNKANSQNWRGVYFVDCGKESGATGTSWVNFAPSAFTDYGANIWDGVVPGRDPSSANTPDVGISVSQSRNMILGPKGYKGTNVILAAGVTNTTVMLNGAVSGADDVAVIDNSANLTNVYSDNYLRTHRRGSWNQDEKIAAGGGAGMRVLDAVTPGNGALWLGNNDVRLQAGSTGILFATADNINFRDQTLTSYGQIDRYAGWILNGAIQLASPATTTTAPTAGAAGALPATPAGYVTITIAGVARKLPYY